MQTWYQLIPKNTGLSIYAWVIFCLLPFYFIIIYSTPIEILIGGILVVMFFTAYRLAFIKKGWTVYVAVGIEMVISIGMTLYFGYVYFSLFLSFFIGNIQNRAGFITLYVVHLVTTITSVVLGFFFQTEIMFTQLPFIVITVVGAILLPFTMYNRIKREQLESQLADAEQRISQLKIIEERERIARDLHDTLGQKLSLIGLKSDLAGKLIQKNSDRAIKEIDDINQTARTALKEVRELVSTMKRTKLKDEIVRVEQILEVADVKFNIKGNPHVTSVPLLEEHVLSMCLKEAINNVVKHSQATKCEVEISESKKEVTISVKDNGIGINGKIDSMEGYGILGMKERLEFVNGNLEIESNKGTRLTIKVPLITKQK